MFRFDFSTYGPYEYFVVGANWENVNRNSLLYLLQLAATFDIYTLPYEESLLCIQQFREELTAHMLETRPTREQLQESGFTFKDDVAENSVDTPVDIPEVFKTFLNKLDNGE